MKTPFASLSCLAVAAAAFAGDDAEKDRRFQDIALPAGAVARIGRLPRGHVGAVLAIAIRDDGLIASAGEDGTVRFWDRRTGAHRSVLAVLPRFEAAALSPDGKWIGGVHAYFARFATLEPFERPWVPKFDRTDDSPNVPASMSFSADGGQAAWAGKGGGGTFSSSVSGDERVLEGSAIAPFSSYHFALSKGAEVVAGYLTNKYATPQRFRPFGEAFVTAVWATSDGRTIVTGCETGEFALHRLMGRLWEDGEPPPSSTRVGPASGHPVRAISASADGVILVVADGTRVRVCDPRTGAVKASAEMPAEVRSLGVSADHRHVAAGFADGTFELREMKLGLAEFAEPRRFGGAAPALTGLDVRASADGATVSARRSDGALVLSGLSGASVEELRPDPDGTQSLAVSPDLGALVRSDGRTVCLATRKGADVWRIPLVAVDFARFATDGRTVALMDDVGTVRIVSVGDGSVVGDAPAGPLLWRGTAGPLCRRGATGRLRVVGENGVAQDTPDRFVDGGAVAALSRGGAFLCLYDGRTPELTLRPRDGPARKLVFGEGPEDSFSSRPVAAVFSDDETLVAAALLDGRILTWATSSGERVARYDADVGTVVDLRFVPGGAQLVSASTDGTCLVWSAPAAK